MKKICVLIILLIAVIATTVTAMTVLYDEESREVVLAVYDADVFKFNFGTQFSTFEIDEVDPDNKLLCQELSRDAAYINTDGQHRYYYGTDNELYERDDWVEAPIVQEPEETEVIE